jgi:hypothetical protein
MPYRVEARIIGDQLAPAMSAMRTWLDQHRLEPDSFRESRSGSTTIFIVAFKAAPDAAAFAEAFSGRVLAAETGALLDELPSKASRQPIG